MPSKMVGAESAALSASRMSRERSAGELHSRETGAGERNRTVVSALAWPHSAVEPHPLRKFAIYNFTIYDLLIDRSLLRKSSIVDRKS